MFGIKIRLKPVILSQANPSQLIFWMLLWLFLLLFYGSRNTELCVCVNKTEPLLKLTIQVNWHHTLKKFYKYLETLPLASVEQWLLSSH